jgi:hypothetical protein
VWVLELDLQLAVEVDDVLLDDLLLEDSLSEDFDSGFVNVVAFELDWLVDVTEVLEEVFELDVLVDNAEVFREEELSN